MRTGTGPLSRAMQYFVYEPPEWYCGAVPVDRVRSSSAAMPCYLVMSWFLMSDVLVRMAVEVQTSTSGGLRQW